MIKKERHAYILHQLDLHNKVVSMSLCSDIEVSEDTIRRDLQELSDLGKLIKIHGGAVSKSFYHTASPNQNGVYAHLDKKTIASKAASLIKNGMFVLTGGGTTMLELARCLPKDLRATFITGSIPAINAYMQHPNIEVIVLGDKLSKSSMITTGAEVITKLKSLKPDLCMMGINAIEPDAGITDNDWDIVQLKKAMIDSAKKTVCLTISEKINTVQPLKVCDVGDVHTIITELSPENVLLKPYREKGLELI